MWTRDIGIYDGLLIGIFPCGFLPKTFHSAIIFCGAGGFLWWQWGNSAAIWLQQHPGTFDNSLLYFSKFSAIDTHGLRIHTVCFLYVDGLSEIWKVPHLGFNLRSQIVTDSARIHISMFQSDWRFSGVGVLQGFPCLQVSPIYHLHGVSTFLLRYYSW
jgi:hypothetical protein